MPGPTAKGDILKLKLDFSELFRGLDAYEAKVAEDMKAAGQKIGLDGLGRMVEAAPVISGYLRGSGSVHVNGSIMATGQDVGAGGEGNPNISSSPTKGDKSTLIVWGFNAHYAARRHEDPRAGLKAGGGKFVEKIIVSRAPRWMEFLAEELRK